MSLPLIGAKISLIANSNVRYVGTLLSIDPNDSSMTLINVKCFGTEGRPGDRVPPQQAFFETITFKGNEIAELKVQENIVPNQYQGPVHQQIPPAGFNQPFGMQSQNPYFQPNPYLQQMNHMQYPQQFWQPPANVNPYLPNISNNFGMGFMEPPITSSTARLNQSKKPVPAFPDNLPPSNPNQPFSNFPKESNFDNNQNFFKPQPLDPKQLSQPAAPKATEKVVENSEKKPPIVVKKASGNNLTQVSKQMENLQVNQNNTQGESALKINSAPNVVKGKSKQTIQNQSKPTEVDFSAFGDDDDVENVPVNPKKSQAPRNRDRKKQNDGNRSNETRSNENRAENRSNENRPNSSRKQTRNPARNQSNENLSNGTVRALSATERFQQESAKQRNGLNEVVKEPDAKENGDAEEAGVQRQNSKRTTNGNRNQRRPNNNKKIVIPDEEFDFNASNAKFDKEIESPVEVSYYSKSSFFDDISCDAKDRLANESIDRKAKMSEERNLNLETFGQSGVRHNFRRGSARNRHSGGGRNQRGGRGQGNNDINATT